LSVPSILAREITGVPADVPYLAADPGLVETWKTRLAEHTGFRVGIHWQGNTQFQRDHHRSVPLRHFAPLADVPGVTLVSVQYGEGRGQLATAPEKLRVPDLAAEFDDARGAFMDSAAVLKNLDLLIASDTAVVHLAGALDVPVWAVMGVGPDWRWLREGETCPWYPGVRMFRQAKLGEWDPVFARIADALEKHVRKPSGGRAKRRKTGKKAKAAKPGSTGKGAGRAAREERGSVD
jgi:hypothetical protein